jgi:outer membrane autotransporter protein
MQNLRSRFETKQSPPEEEIAPKTKKSFFSPWGPSSKTAAVAAPRQSAQFASLPVQTISNEIADGRNALAFLGWNRREHGEKTCEQPRICCAEERHWNIYFGPLGTVGEIHNKNNQPGFSDWSVGGLTGFDYAFEQGGIGLLADYEKIIGSVHQNWGRFDIKQAHFSFYATYVPKSADRLSFDAIVGGGYDWYHIHRHTPGKTAKGTTQGKEFDALFGLAYIAYGKQDWCGPTKLQVTPMANLQYIYLDRSQYKEHGANLFDFNVHSQINKSLRSTLGTWISYGAAWENFSFTPELYLAWQREYFDHHQSLSASPLLVVEPTQSLTVFGAGRNTFQAGLDLMFTMFNQYGIEVSYDFEWNKLFHDQAFYVGFNVEF